MTTSPHNTKASQLVPVIRVAPFGVLKIYPLAESELDELARGGNAGLYLNLAIFFLSICPGFAIPLWTGEIDSLRTFIVFTVLACLGGALGLVFTVLWLSKRRLVSQLVKEIKERMPGEGIQKSMTETGD